MPDKTAGPGLARPPAAPYDKTLPNGSQAGNNAARRLVDRQRVERERLDRYGRFGGR